MMSRDFMKPEQSSALKSQSGEYPAAWDGRIPKRVQMLQTVRSIHSRVMALTGYPFNCWVGCTGMVIVLFESGEALMVHPGEFFVIEWHER